MKKRDWSWILLLSFGLLIFLVVRGEPGMLIGSHAGNIITGGLKISPATSRDFGTVTATTTAQFSFTITATGTTITPGTWSMDGTNYTDFSYTHNLGTATTLAPGGTALVTVTFTPPTTPTGGKNATIHVPYTW
jgi:hypothetical protein